MDKSKKWLKANYDRLRDKRLGDVLNTWVPYVHKEVRCEMALLTVQYDPNKTKKAEEGWKEVKEVEEKIVNILAMEKDILYVVSVVETHTGGKEKKEKEEEKKLIVKTQEDVVKVFKKYNEEIVEEESKEDKEIRRRLYKHMEGMLGRIGEEQKVVKEAIKVILEKKPDEIPRALMQFIIIDLNGTVIKEKDEKKTLKGYPHIHMAVAFTTETGEIRDLNEIKRKIQVYAQDVDFRKKDGTGTGRRKGRKIRIENDTKILGYVMKNARHSETMNRLGREPLVVYNYRKDKNIKNMYEMIYRETPVIMRIENKEREKIEIRVAMEIEKEEEGENKETNLAREVTKKPITKSKKMRMLNLVKTYLERNQMGITPRGTIYKRVEESKKSWKYWGNQERLYEEMCDMENFELMDATRQQFFTYTTGKFKKLLPYVDLKYEWIEFKDFMYNVGTGETIVEGIEERECESFSYIPEIEYKDVYPNMLKMPDKWLKILENSGYIKEGDITERGYELMNAIQDIYKKKTHKSKGLVLYGDSNSGKSSLIEPIYKLYPEDVVMKITAAGGFELAGLVDKPQIIISEEHDKGKLRREQTLVLVEGDVEMAINIKHKNTETVKVEARTIFMCNDIDWAYKKDATLLTFLDEKGNEIENSNIDEAYENRMLFCKMRSLKECVAENRRKMVEEERGLIPIYVGNIIKRRMGRV